MNNTKNYNSTIKPLVTDILNKCTIYNIPFFFTAAVENDAEHTEYIMDGVPKSLHEINLTEDRMILHEAVGNGKKAVPAKARGDRPAQEFKKKDTVDYTEKFENIVRPVLNEVIKNCTKHDIPFYFSAVIKNSAEKTVYVSEYLQGEDLADDQIDSHIKIDQGYTIKFFGREIDEIEEPQELEMDDVPEDYELPEDEEFEDEDDI